MLFIVISLRHDLDFLLFLLSVVIKHVQLDLLLDFFLDRLWLLLWSRFAHRSPGQHGRQRILEVVTLIFHLWDGLRPGDRNLFCVCASERRLGFFFLLDEGRLLELLGGWLGCFLGRFFLRGLPVAA